jgi:HAD superfamily hydrolase (TIGR01450 family)
MPTSRPDDHPIEVVLCDLDGVVWLARQPIDGAPEAIARLRERGRRVLFVTNNSVSPVREVELALGSLGVPAHGDVLTSAQAAAFLLAPADRVLVAGAAGVVEAVEARGAVVTESDDADAVVVGLHDHFDYHGLELASTAIRNGARFIATNDDATFPTPDGPIPGAGALVAAVRTASATAPIIAGKPHQPMADLVVDRCGAGFSPARAVVVGDRASTDGRFAATLGCRFVLVRTGVTAPGRAPDDDVAIAHDTPSLATFADSLDGS